MTTAIFAGTFDPVTNGHLDVVRRAARRSSTGSIDLRRPLRLGQTPVSIDEERVALFEAEPSATLGKRTPSRPSTASSWSRPGKHGADGPAARGVRGTQDWDYEMQMAFANREPGRGDRQRLPAALAGHGPDLGLPGPRGGEPRRGRLRVGPGGRPEGPARAPPTPRPGLIRRSFASTLWGHPPRTPEQSPCVAFPVSSSRSWPSASCSSRAARRRPTRPRSSSTRTRLRQPRPGPREPVQPERRAGHPRALRVPDRPGPRDSKARPGAAEAGAPRPTRRPGRSSCARTRNGPTGAPSPRRTSSGPGSA